MMRKTFTWRVFALFIRTALVVTFTLSLIEHARTGADLEYYLAFVCLMLILIQRGVERLEECIDKHLSPAPEPPPAEKPKIRRVA